jgi:phosphatidylglycerol:prolipoprotein diacylglycerol transferase
MIELSEFFNNPSLIQIGPLKIQYYALTWILSAVFIFQFLKHHKISKELGLDAEKINDMVFFYGLFMGAMCGGRIGYMLFYAPSDLISDPLSLIRIWEGGLSFHGGLLGVILALIYFCKKQNIYFPRLMDSVALGMPIGLGLVRVGNFLNGELYGRPTNGEWGFVFPTDPFSLPRHPSQLYESFGEGIVLFLLLYILSKYIKAKGVVASSFLIFYGSIRFIIEYFRQPDAHIGCLNSGMTMGQLLCVPMIFIGIILVLYFWKKNESLSRTS